MFGVKQVKFLGGGLPTLYLVTMLVLRPLELSTFLSRAFSAPLFLLVPTGLGLLLCFGWTATLPSQLTRVQGFLIAYLFGTLFLVYLYVILERYSPDTRAWLADRPSYFPISGSLPEKVAANISTYYRSAKLYKNTYVIKIQCR